MFFRLSSVVLVFALVVLGKPVKRDAMTFQKDISNIEAKVTTLDDSINAFPASGGTFAQVLAIHGNVVELNNALFIAWMDVSVSPPFTNDEGTALLESIKYFAAATVKTTSDLEAKKDALTAIGTGRLVKYDLEMVELYCARLASQAIEKFPEDQQAAVKEQFDKVQAALQEAMKVYST